MRGGHGASYHKRIRLLRERKDAFLYLNFFNRKIQRLQTKKSSLEVNRGGVKFISLKQTGQVGPKVIS